MRILVTGATGTVGRGVVEQLLTRGAEVRAMSRNPAVANLPEAAEVVGGDLSSPDTLNDAFAGIERLYLFPIAEAAQAVVDLARRAGIRRIVVLSGATADDLDEPGGMHYRAVERAVENSGLEWTHVRPGMFASNTLEWAGAIRNGGPVPVVYPDAAQPPIHEGDISAVITEALLTDDHVGARYILSGPESLTKPQQVASIGSALGRDIEVKEITPGQWRESMVSVMPDAAIDWLLSYWAKAVDRPDPVTDTVERVLGRPARTLREWAAEHAEDFR